MKINRNILLTTGMAVCALIAFDLKNSEAQPPSVTLPPANTNLQQPVAQPAAPAPPPTPGMPPAPGPGPRPIMRGPASTVIFQRSIQYLKMSKSQLEHSENDFGGHKQSAIAACDKAIEELDAALRASPPLSPPAPKPAPGPQPPPSVR